VIALSPARRRTNSPPTHGDYSIGHELLGTTAPTSPDRQTPRHNRTKKQSAILHNRRIAIGTLTQPFDAYLAMVGENARAIALKALKTDFFTVKATKDAAMLVDSEPAPPPEQLQQLIKKSVDSATKSFQQETAQLRAAVNKKGDKPSTDTSARNNSSNRA
jgi:hypothetical protein